jgi:hypothetical protein
MTIRPKQARIQTIHPTGETIMRLSQISLVIVAGLLAAQTNAADAPRRKSGLWEMKTQMAGMPSRGPMQMCVDQASDNLMQERAQEKINCPVMDVNRSAGKVTIHSVCKHDTITSTSDAVITGDFDSSYHSDMVIRYDPPQQGMKELKMVQDARWLGPCKAGQKPGDLIMPGMPAVNMQEMMKDPQVREMMKRQQQGK